MINCVDVQHNTCIFGYGGVDIQVIGTVMICRGIRPPQGAGTRIYNKDGTKLGDWEHTGEKISITFITMKDIGIISEYLKNIEENQGGSFRFKDVKFDFKEYKQASMNVVKTAIEDVRRNLLKLIAC